MNIGRVAVVNALALSALTVAASFGGTAQGPEFQSNAAAADLITYSFHESNQAAVVLCSVGNTQNVNVAGGETTVGGITAIKIDQGGDCTFYLSAQQDQGTYHLQFRLRAEVSSTNTANTNAITIRILTNFRTTDSLYYGVIIPDSTGIAFANGPAGTNGADQPWGTFDATNAALNVVRDWHTQDNMASQINFKNNGAQRIYLDALYLSSAQ